jgi:16S rRNA (uracil1498-N3)-methyltransferase
VLREPRDVALLALPGDQMDRKADPSLKEAERVLLLVGPEGGWSGDELRIAEEAGLVNWTFGANVMRIETAAPIAVALLRYLCA